jgi:hypothetical protein
VTEPGLSSLDVDTLADRQSGVGPTQMVKTEVRQSDPPAGRLPNPLTEGRV